MKQTEFSYRQLQRSLEEAKEDSLSEREAATLRLCFRGHQGQFRATRIGQSQIPYIVHPVGVASLALKYHPLVRDHVDDREIIICVALAHDLLEDTRVSRSEVEAVAGATVAKYVEALSKPWDLAENLERDSRTRIFVDQIEAAGPTCIFVRACDSMHNLTRAYVTPISLYKKMLDKSVRFYLPMIESSPFSAEFRNIYQTAIQQAGYAALEEEEHQQPLLPATSLESSISLCVAGAKSKTMELHDVADLLKLACNCNAVSIWHFSSANSSITPAWSTSSGVPETIELGENSLIAEVPQVLRSLNKNHEDIANLTSKKVLYTIPIQLTSERRSIVVVEFVEGYVAPWLTLDAITMIVHFAVNRLVVAATDRKATLAVVAADAGLSMDVDLAYSLGVRPSDIQPLHHWLLRSRQAVALVESLVDVFCCSDPVCSAMHELIRVESRVKSVNSLLRKMQVSRRYVWPHFANIEDIAGVRVICPNYTVIRRFENWFLSHQSTESKVRIHPSIRNPHRDYISEPMVSGYKAVHLILSVDTHVVGEGQKTVPCELQIRTIFQDASARISHSIQYQTSRTHRRKLSDLWKALGHEIENCEEILDTIIQKSINSNVES